MKPVSERDPSPADSFRDPSPDSFRRKVRGGFTHAALLILILSAVALVALHATVSGDRSALNQSREIMQFGRFQTAFERNRTALREYLRRGDERALATFTNGQTVARGFLRSLDGSVRALHAAFVSYEQAAGEAIAARRSGAASESIRETLSLAVESRGEILERAMARYLETKERSLGASDRQSRQTNQISFAVLASIGVTALATLLVLSTVLSRRLSAILEAEREERQRAETAAAALTRSEERFRRFYDSRMIGIGFTDLSGKLVDGNDAFLEILGLSRADLQSGRPRWDELTPPEWRAADEQAFRELRETGVFHPYEKEYFRPDGQRIPVLAGGALLPGTSTGAVAFLLDITARKRAEAERAELLERERMARAEAEAAGRRASFLAGASKVLASSLDYDTTLQSVAKLAVPEISDWCFIDLIRGGTFCRVAVSHAGPEEAPLAVRLRGQHLLDPDARLGPPQVLRSGISELVPRVTDEYLEAVARTPEALAALREIHIVSLMSVAVRDSESITGIVTFMSSKSGRRFGTEDLHVAEDLAVRAGVAMENARLFDLIQEERASAEWQGRRSTFLARASEILASSLDYRTTLASVARLAVPEVADWCVIDVVEPDDSLKTIAVHHSDPAKVEAALEIGRRFPYSPAQPCFAPHVVQTGNPERAAEIPDEMLRGASRNEEHYRLLAGLAFHSYMCVPLQARSQVLGAITFASAESRRKYALDDLHLAEDLAYRASLAIDNARLYREAQDAIHGRDEFLSIASHELKTPITTLQLQIQGLLRRIQIGGAEAARTGITQRLETSERQIERLTHLINDLVDISRMTAGRLELHMEDVDFAEVVRDVATRLEEGVSRSGCTLTLRPAEPQQGEWDRLRLEQIVTNLMSNAMKYGAGGPIDVSLEGTASSVRLEVTDRGIGIAPENQSRIFGRFERAVSERHYGGLGLGLWIVRQIVDALGGSIFVRSAAGEGSCFVVELPRRRVRTRATPADAAIASEIPHAGAQAQAPGS